MTIDERIERIERASVRDIRSSGFSIHRFYVGKYFCKKVGIETNEETLLIWVLEIGIWHKTTIKFYATTIEDVLVKVEIYLGIYI